MHKIMIIEDDPSTREELTLLLENEGHQVLAVTDLQPVGLLPGPAQHGIDPGQQHGDVVRLYDNTLSVNMTRLRGKLEGLKLPDYIRTRRGLGYQV